MGNEIDNDIAKTVGEIADRLKNIAERQSDIIDELEQLLINYSVQQRNIAEGLSHEN